MSPVGGAGDCGARPGRLSDRLPTDLILPRPSGKRSKANSRERRPASPAGAHRGRGWEPFEGSHVNRRTRACLGTAFGAGCPPERIMAKTSDDKPEGGAGNFV